MHDMLPIEKIYSAVKVICLQKSYVKIKKLIIEADESCQTNASVLLSDLKSLDGELFGDWTEIIIQPKRYEKLTAVIKGIEGE